MVSVPEYRRKEILNLYQVFTTKAVDFAQRRREFLKVLRLYYKWAGPEELEAMFAVVYHHEVHFQGGLLATDLVNQNTSLILELFGRMDEDRNGVLDVHEFEKVLPASMFAAADSNGDGVLTLAEFTAFLSRHSHCIEPIRRYLQSKSEAKREARRKRLDALFVAYPKSPGSGWRPSLSVLRRR